MVFQLQLKLHQSAATPNWTHVVWNHVPININLPIGKEKIVKFPNSVSFGLPGRLASKVFIQNNSGWLYITAYKKILKTRVEVKDNRTGEIILLNIEANKSAGDNATSILYQGAPTQIRSQNDTPQQLKGQFAYITLTKYAAQQLYPIVRLRKNPYNIQLMKSYVNKRGSINRRYWVYNFFIDRSAVAMPIASWYGGNYYITAVKVRNLIGIPVDLRKNLNVIYGRIDSVWKAVSFFPSWRLARSGKLHDTTIAFLISQEPFSEAIKSANNNGK